MTRIVSLLPLALLAACDVTSTEPFVPAAALEEIQSVPIVVQPYAAKRVLNLAIGGYVTVALKDVDGFVYTVDPMSVTFEGAHPVHDLANETMAADHIQTVTILDADGLVVEQYLAYLFHFAPEDIDVAASTEPVTLCLEGTSAAGAFVGCEDVVVMAQGGRK